MYFGYKFQASNFLFGILNFRFRVFWTQVQSTLIQLLQAMWSFPGISILLLAIWVLQGLIYGCLASHLNTNCEALPQAIWILYRFSYSYPTFIMSIRCMSSPSRLDYESFETRMSSPSRLPDMYVESETTRHVCRVRDYQTRMSSPSRLPDTYVESFETTRHI